MFSLLMGGDGFAWNDRDDDGRLIATFGMNDNLLTVADQVSSFAEATKDKERH